MPAWHLPARAAVVVAAAAPARGLIAGLLNGPAGKAPWVREVRACEAAPAGKDVPNPVGRKRCAPTAAAAWDKGRHAAVARVLVQAGDAEWASVEVRHLVSAAGEVSAEWERGEWDEAEGLVLVAAGGRQYLSVEARHPALALDGASVAVADRE